MTVQLLNSILGGVAVVLLAAIGRGLLGVRRDFRRFMAEHSWLLATGLWNRDKVRHIMASLGMPVEDNPPDDLPWKQGAPTRKDSSP